MRSELLHQQYPDARVLWNGTASAPGLYPHAYQPDPRLLLDRSYAGTMEPRSDQGRTVGKIHAIGGREGR